MTQKLQGRSPFTNEVAHDLSVKKMFEVQCSKCTQVFIYFKDYNSLTEVLKALRKHTQQHIKEDNDLERHSK